MENKKNPNLYRFDLRSLTMREFETFLILLLYEGNELGILKNHIDQVFDFKDNSRTKGYDYINSLCKVKKREEKKTGKKEIIRLAYAEKKLVRENGKTKTKVYIKEKIRDSYEKFIAPTIKDNKKAFKGFLKDNLEEINNAEKFKRRLTNYTEKINKEIQKYIEKECTSGKEFKTKILQNEMHRIIQKIQNEELVIGAYQIIPEK